MFSLKQYVIAALALSIGVVNALTREATWYTPNGGVGACGAPAQEVCGYFAFQRGLHNTATSTATGPSSSLSEVSWAIMFLSFSLGTTLWCTTLIIYRILTFKKYIDDNINTRTYRRVVEILVESALLYVIGVIGYMILYTFNVATSAYPQTLYVSITAISPTLIVARVASGNARPDDSWQASNGASSLRFGQAVHSTSMNADSELSADIDLEHGESETTDNFQLEDIVNTKKGADETENRGTEVA